MRHRKGHGCAKGRGLRCFDGHRCPRDHEKETRGRLAALPDPGRCNPPLAHQALQAEDKIGTMLPCNVIVQDVGDGRVEVAAIDPVDTMERFGNAKLLELARLVRGKLSNGAFAPVTPEEA